MDSKEEDAMPSRRRLRSKDALETVVVRYGEGSPLWTENMICRLCACEDTMRSYIQQLRQEMGIRICDKVFDAETDKPSKVICVYTLFGF